MIDPHSSASPFPADSQAAGADAGPVYLYSSVEGPIPLFGHNGDGEGDPQASYRQGLLLTFKKEFVAGAEYLERAHRLYHLQQDTLGALRCQVELAWLKFNSESGEDARLKANRLFSDARQQIEAASHLPGISDIRARFLHYQGLVRYRAGDYGAGVRLFKEARTLCRPDSLEAAKIQDSLAIFYERIGDFQNAVRSLRASLEIKQRVAPNYEQAITAQILGRLSLMLEAYEESQHCLELSLRISEALDDHKRSARLRSELTRLALYRGHTEEAERLIEESLSRCRATCDWGPYAWALVFRAFLLYRQKDYKASQTLLDQEVFPLLDNHRHQLAFGTARRLQAALALLDGNHPLAIEAMSDAVAAFQDESRMDELVKTHLEFGRLYADMGNRPLAVQCFLEALRIAETNSLVMLARHIEDEILLHDEERWKEIIQKRATHQSVLGANRASLLDALSALSASSPTPPANDDASASVDVGEGSPLLIAPLVSLLKVGQAMAEERDLEKLLLVITRETELALGADRCTVFLYDRDRNELWSKVASGLDTEEVLRIPAHKGLAGYVAKTGEILNIPHAYEDPRFNQEVDRKTGYRTHNLLCMPVRNRKREIIGVFQVLNKRSGSFDKSDEDLLMAISASAAVAIENATLVTDQRRAFESFIKTLSSTIDARDPITAGHSERVAEYSVLLGEEMSLSNAEMEALKYASLLHDIGKIGIKEDILVKDGRLTEQEYRHIQKHACYTYDILKNIHFERHLKTVPEIAAAHHEKVDGSGYFRGLKGPEIPLSGRILAISDVFDAITSKRHYRSRMSFGKVLGILRRDAGTHFDPDCVETFFNVHLYRVAQVLIRERALYVAEHGHELVRQLDKIVTLRDYEEILRKKHRSKTENTIHEVFSALYVAYGDTSQD